VNALAVVAAALALIAWARLALLGMAGRRALIRLAPPGDAPVPSVTVIVPCRDEAHGLERAMRSLLAQDVPDLRILAVDDRSTDGSGAILDRLASADPRLEVLHVAALPDGWLGKNHACHAGAGRARGAWLLFTDADVVLAPGALRAALAAAEARGLGHLAVVPRFVAPGLLERAFVTAFAALFAPFVRVDELRRPATRAYFGVGAFNLVRRDAYEAAGGHARLALEVVDDLKLGLLLRRSGVPQGVADAGLVSVRWQHGFAPSVLGLVKNAFAALEYRPGRAAAAALLGAFAGAAPLAIVLLGPTPLARGLAAAALAIAVAHHAEAARRLSGASGAEGLLMPVCAVLLSGVVLASAAAAWARGGVVWRGTYYPLERIRAGCLREDDLPASGAVGWVPPDELPSRPAVPPFR
jgi:Glycosyl transferase family 2